MSKSRMQTVIRYTLSPVFFGSSRKIDSFNLSIDAGEEEDSN